MSTSDLTVTLVGWVATEPKHYTGAGSTPFTSFRMANTRRYFDRVLNTWADGRTEWFTVKVWRQAALNAATSLRKGDPVLVHGRLATEQWDGPEGQRTSLVLEALAIGPDLTYGRATFARTVHVGASGPGAGGAEDGPATGGRVQGAEGAEGVEGVGDGPDDADDPWAADLPAPDVDATAGRRYGGTAAAEGAPDPNDDRPGSVAARGALADATLDGDRRLDPVG